MGILVCIPLKAFLTRFLRLRNNSFIVISFVPLCIGSYRFYLLPCQFMTSMVFTSCTPTFHHLIPHIINRCPKEEVVNSDASRIVTLMKDPHSFWYLSSFLCPDNTRYKPIFTTKPLCRVCRVTSSSASMRRTNMTTTNIFYPFYRLSHTVTREMFSTTILIFRSFFL
jgi:hypothetical protein